MHHHQRRRSANPHRPQAANGGRTSVLREGCAQKGIAWRAHEYCIADGLKAVTLGTLHTDSIDAGSEKVNVVLQALRQSWLQLVFSLCIHTKFVHTIPLYEKDAPSQRWVTRNAARCEERVGPIIVNQQLR